MKDLLLLRMKKFLDRKPTGPLLIGCSGGPDSKALLHLLFGCRKFFPLDLHIAHVDHGWRDESGMEAEKLREEVEGLGLPFHLKTLSINDFRPGNLEEQGREHRLKFFAEIYAKVSAHALLLGHQADDQAETVLKRLFEGASLYSLRGLSLETTLAGMTVWRPLLRIPKKEIIAWLGAKGIGYFEDATNRDSRFLRGKMRETILPSLATAFGKEISGNLSRLGEESREVREYFQELNRPILERFDGDLSPYLSMPPLQLKFLLREWFEREKITVSREIIDEIVLKKRINLIKNNNLIK